MSPKGARRQKPEQLGLPLEDRGEAPKVQRSGEAPTMANGGVRSGSDRLMEQVVARGNVRAALARVRENRGSPGVDGMTVEELPQYLMEHWPEVREQLLAGTYQPKAVRRREIPKASGGMRELGIPCVLDRLIQQALLQMVAELRKYLPGWKQYFQLAATPSVFAEHDKWLRHRLRALQLKQWKRGSKVYAELRKLGVPPTAAARVAANTRRWWRNARMLVQLGLTTRYYDRIGVPRLAG